VQTTEVHQRGYQDYWFINDSDKDVTVGLNAKGCTCSEVELTIAPPSWMPYLALSTALQALQLPLRGLDNLTTLAVACQREHQFPEMPQGGENTMLTQEFSAKVPAGAIGRVRLSWRQEVVKLLSTYADLWIGQRGGSGNARLETRVAIAPALNVNKDLTMPTVSERQLEMNEKSISGSILCFSLTRPVFHLKAELLHSRFKLQSDPIEVGEPVPISPSGLRYLENELGRHPDKQESAQRMTVLSGYRIPVTVRAKAKDGTPMEWGRYHRVVLVSSTDPGIDPIQVQVSGEVLGDISVGGGDEMGTINLGPFPRTRGARHSIVLQTDEKGIDLELDTTRKPNFLNVTLSKPEESAGGHRSWVLSVEVPPNAARGEFPLADNPDYRDSAIYVKTRGGKSGRSLRSIRVPVRGVANEG